MAKDKSLKKVLIIGSGPIVIGQACEFDYSGTQACKALMAEGLEVILVNSNPATIMTDPEVASRIYIEPLQPEFLKKILIKEKPDAVIPTLGGQTALNLALELEASGIFKELDIRLLGANADIIKAAEDRELFSKILDKVGAKYPKSQMVRTYEDGLAVADKFGLPIILRPNFTLGGGGGGIAYSLEEYQQKLAAALHASPTNEVLVEESILGWKEFELEVMRDHRGTFVVVCSIENFDPCGVHTGDSITMAPQQTLSDREYQAMRDEAKKITEHVGVQTGGANIQFAVHPQTGERYVIEMNPRVSRSSALASKATGFPIAKIAALLAIGYSLDELKNDITKETPSCYEPALDYVVTKIPRFAFEKFPGSKDTLSTQMKSVGEAMGIGRTLKESMMKAIHSLEFHAEGLNEITLDEKKLAIGNSERFWHLAQAFREGWTVEQLEELTSITAYFLEQLEQIVLFEKTIKDSTGLEKDLLLRAKRLGISDARIAKLKDLPTEAVHDQRVQQSILPIYYQVDTCAGEFASETPYYYSTYWGRRSHQLDVAGSRIVVLGSGPNRIGQGIEFDYSCVRTVNALKKKSHRVVMINSNPETVSTDYDTSDELFFEPLTEEHVAEVLRFIDPMGVIIQVGGQTPISLAPSIQERSYKILGSSLEAIDGAEDRGLFVGICKELGLHVPQSGMAADFDQALKITERCGFPILCRPSYVLGGRRMEIVESVDELKSYFERHAAHIGPKAPCLIDEFLDRALELDVDLVRGRDWTVIGGIMEHIEAAGVHSGDSMGVLPPQRLKEETMSKVEEISRRLADRLNVIGFLNLQLAIKDDDIYVLEANPRSSRSLPFMAKATGLPLVDLGAWAMLDVPGKDLDIKKYDWKKLEKVCVKGVVFPFSKFKDSDSILGPEMKSTGESMGRGDDYAEALMKALIQAHGRIPYEGKVFVSLREKDKSELLKTMKTLKDFGFQIIATGGTHKFLVENGVEAELTRKVHEGRPNCVDLIRSGEIDLVINTTSGQVSIEASFGIRRSCVDYSVPCITESDAAKAFVIALKRRSEKHYEVSYLPPSI